MTLPSPSSAEETGTDTPPAQRRPTIELAGLLSLGLAVLFYMGWAYTSSYYGYFHINPRHLDMSVTEYALRSSTFVSPAMIMIGAVLVTGTALRGWLSPPFAGREHARWARRRRWMHANASHLLRGAGLASTMVGVGLYVLAHHFQIPTPAIVLLLGTGPLLACRPQRGTVAGRWISAAATSLAILCALWAASLHAAATGAHAAEDFAAHLLNRPAAVVYTTERLSLQGPGIRALRLDLDTRFRYRYTGLRLLAIRADRFYLLPVNWTPKEHATYIFKEGDDVRIEIYSGTR
ncbi:hypothetical protein [Actinomadura sp. 7K507]|uniref:hypothetical protein n=1 Tax=Actinomadura sp. 7K507 TaxID=2530365 RepID=UPI0010430E6D|nr:hypothetical protein [Actinomadura sp. 7K507]TDC86479.1 hypothetical protein E1285_23260 [Actinomadura sp. 7K507]